ncbi:MAG: hypothetical protein U0800_04090 [Isosphaeraceae bacterium]
MKASRWKRSSCAVRAFLAAAALASLAADARAQATFSLSSGDATFSLGDVPGAADGSPASIVLRAGGGGNPNQAFQSWWWYRLAGDTRESAFHAANPVWTVNGAGNEATATFTISPTLTGTMTWTLLGLGLGKLQLDSTMTIRNTGTQAATVDLFHYLDLDLGGTRDDDSGAYTPRSGGTIPVITVTDPGWTADYIGDSAGFLGYRNAAFSTIRTQLTNNAVDNFNSTAANFGPGDWTGGYQWSKTIDAGATSRTRATVLLVPEPASLLLAGTGLAIVAAAAAGRRWRAV